MQLQQIGFAPQRTQRNTEIVVQKAHQSQDKNYEIGQ
jgi:hypothetical protein